MTDSTSLDEVMSRIQSFREADTDDLEELSELLGLDLLKDYAGADLREVDLSYKKLEGADFSYSDLQGANLSHSNLRGANLEGANLSKANLTHADLTDANLSSANLTEAFLNDALGIEQNSNQEAYEDTDWDINLEIEFAANSPEDIELVALETLIKLETSSDSEPLQGGIIIPPLRVFNRVIAVSFELFEIIQEKTFSQGYFSNTLTWLWNVFSESLKRILPGYSESSDDFVSILSKEKLLSGKILSFDRANKVITLQVQSERDEEELDQIFSTLKEGKKLVILDGFQDHEGGAESLLLSMSSLLQESFGKGSVEVTVTGQRRLGISRSRRRWLKSQPTAKFPRGSSSQVIEVVKGKPVVKIKSDEEVIRSQNIE